LAIPENGWPGDVAHDEQTGRNGALALKRFPAKRIPVRVKKTRQNKEIEPPV
jgi:hypothetical protein